MSDRERERLQEVAQGRGGGAPPPESRGLAAYKATHIVHLGEGVFWTDGRGHDKWDLPNAEDRAAENELPPLDSPSNWPRPWA